MNDPVVPVSGQPWRIAGVALLFVALFAALGWRLHELQVVQGPKLADLGARQRQRTWVIQAPRGAIYDASGVPLAVSDPRWSLYCDPGYMDDKLRATSELPKIIDVPRDELRKHFEASGNGRLVVRGLDDDRAERVRALKLDGIALRRDYIRQYPEGPLASHVLGMVLDDGHGGGGIEQSMQGLLAGSPGRETLLVDARGRTSRVESESKPPEAGAHVVLTIDAIVQRELEAAIAAAAERHRPASISGIVVRPGTGEILAMASWPTFDPRDFAGAKPDQFRNNAICFPYEPGSTVKPLFVGAAVVDGVASWTERISGENGVWVYRDPRGRAARPVHEKTGGHGILSLVETIALSDNIVMAKLGTRIGERYGAKRLQDWLRVLGFGQVHGIALPGEEPGDIGSTARFDLLNSCTRVPMGHAMMVTPLQLAMAHAAVANGGVWQPPRLVRRIFTRDPASGAEQDLRTPTRPQPRRIFPAEEAARIQDAMAHTMTDGTAKASKLEGYSSAGKTGTAEKVINGRYADDRNVGSFVCWAPAEENVRPEALCLVVVDDPTQNGRFGSQTAAPVVQRVLQFTLQHLGVPQRPDLLPQPTVAQQRRRP